MFVAATSSLRAAARAAPPSRCAPAALEALRSGAAAPCRAPAAFVAGVRRFYEDAVASGPNALYLESIYAQWKLDPSSLDSGWDTYFKSLEAGGAAGAMPVSGSVARDKALSARLEVGATAAARQAPSGHRLSRIGDGGVRGVDPIGLQYLIRAYQVRGHEAADIDPLGQHQWRRHKGVKELAPEYHGFKEADMGHLITEGNMLWRSSTGGNAGFLASMGNMGAGEMTLADLIARVRSTYCGTMGVEYMHIGENERLNWIRKHIEIPDFFSEDRAKMLETYERLCMADTFERFLGNKFMNTKRFGLDGGEAVIPGLKALVDRGIELGCEEFIFSMPHRGRLSVLANVIGKPVPQILAEFMGTAYDVKAIVDQLEDTDWSSAGDVKYHLGTSQIMMHDHGSATLTLEANPSHLETVGPVGLGRTRAKQYYLGNTAETRKRVVPIVMHGDASFAGQGVVYESMQLANVADFDVGGTIHIIVNNQVGFTTDPRNSRSTQYCSDLGKAFNVPIFHCNGDDPAAVVRAFEIAMEWRHDWGQDVILDVVCYRRFGHNESDNPEFTQPLLYKSIKDHPRTEAKFAETLLKNGLATEEELAAIRGRLWDQLEADYLAAKDYSPPHQSEWLATKWEGMRRPNELAQKQPTAVDAEVLRKIGLRLCETGEGFTAHSGLKRVLKAKRERIEAGTGIDWGTAEGLAFGTLLLEGNHVRLTGQDVQRGTFSHRHCVVHDQVTNGEYSFLNNLALGPQEQFIARNSILSEYAVLGFELGYSYENPNALSIWEAQFGDFANTAQVIIDQFICAGEHKWLQQSGLVLLLPHGYDGQGAEHSSCRLERFLQLCDDDEDDVPDYKAAGSGMQIQRANWQVMNLTTPANYFHGLRQQLKREFRKPLIVAAPKALLRHKSCVSSLEDMAPGTKFQRVIPERDPAIAGNPGRVERLVFCSGKIYYELLAERQRLGLTNVAIITVEMIAPFPFDKVRDEMKRYGNVDKGDGVHPGSIIWCQEEPKNMGAWAYVRPRTVCVAREALDLDLVLRYVGRRASAAPATGIGKFHTMEQEAIIQEALLGNDKEGASRPTSLLGHQT